MRSQLKVLIDANEEDGDYLPWAEDCYTVYWASGNRWPNNYDETILVRYLHRSHTTVAYRVVDRFLLRFPQWGLP